MRLKFYQFIETIKNSPARQNKFIIIINIICLILNLALWLFLYWQLNKIVKINPEMTTIPLHYNVFLGIDKIGYWYNAFYLPLIGLVILIINFILAIYAYSKKSLASYFLSTSSFFVQIILAASGLLIILINF